MKSKAINPVETVRVDTVVKAAGRVIAWIVFDAKRLFAKVHVERVNVYCEYEGRPERV